MIQIRKRDGSLVPLDIEKVHEVVEMMCEGLDGVSVSEVEINAQLQFTDGMTTERIQEIIIKSAEDLISLEEPNYQYVASRGQLYDVRKRAYGDKIPTLLEHVHNMIDQGKYDPDILNEYTVSEWKRLGRYIDHNRDNNFGYAACGQLLDKYLLRDRTKHRAFYETPQMMYMLISMTLLSGIKDPRKRMDAVMTFYDGASTFKFSLPTPIMAGVRTPTRQFSSCVLIKCGDSLPSINATATAITNYVSKRAGIGIDASAIRAIGSAIRGGEMEHTGVVPFLKYHVGALKSCSQGGVRGGSGTVYYPMWHYQFEDIVVLKNNRGIEENRERRVDYGMQINGELLRRYIKNEDIYFFDPKDVPELYEAFFANQELFKILYDNAIADAETGRIRHKKMSAVEAFDMMMLERTETGRIYIAFVDHMNRHTPFDAQTDPIYQSNLCLEIALPTREFEHQFDENGRIALCTLASFNMSEFLDGDLDEMMRYGDVLVSALDGLLSYQDYPQIQAKLATDEFRTLGIGIVNLADFLAQQGLKYGSSKTANVVNEWMEKFNYALTSASVRLAEENGPCEAWERTCYKEGVFPWEKANPRVDNNIVIPSHLDWEPLRARVLKSGIRNATLSAVAPTESSSQVLNATNGVEMPKAPMSIKASKSGMFKQIIPHPEIIDNYEFASKQKNPQNYLRTIAVIQKHIDQSISTNTMYNPSLTGDVITREQLMRDILTAYTLGVKTLYYSNVIDGASDELEPEEEPECSTCVV